MPAVCSVRHSQYSKLIENREFAKLHWQYFPHLVSFHVSSAFDGAYL
jgi:hypothetical protein